MKIMVRAVDPDKRINKPDSDEQFPVADLCGEREFESIDDCVRTLNRELSSPYGYSQFIVDFENGELSSVVIYNDFIE